MLVIQQRSNYTNEHSNSTPSFFKKSGEEKEIKIMKKALLITFALAIAIATVPMFAAYEAHVINVTAHIENALRVHTDALDFGTVFPQEYLVRDFTMDLSDSFQEQSRADYVDYVIKQKPKCECDRWIDDAPLPENLKVCPDGRYAPVGYATHECPAEYSVMLDLCQFLSKVDNETGDGNDTDHPSYFTDPTPGDPTSGDESCAQPETITSNYLNYSATGWGGWSCPAGTHAVAGRVIENDFPMGDEGIAEPGATIGGFTYPVFPHYTYGAGETGYVAVNGGTSQTVRIEVDCLANNPDATGTLHMQDLTDGWDIDLKVPPVDGTIGQDWPAGCPTVPQDSMDYGCDLWIEVTDIGQY